MPDPVEAPDDVEAPREITPPPGCTILTDLGGGMLVMSVPPDVVREQTVNAQVMAAEKFDQLVANIKARGKPESLPYCAWPNGEGYIEVVSGHHRLRASRVAGLKTVAVLVDTMPMTRSLLTAKQLAHNALTGESDQQVLRRMLEQIDTVDDMLATGLDHDLLPLPESPDKTNLTTPSPDLQWKNVTFTFVPHQLAGLDQLIASIDGRPDLLGVAPIEWFDEFAKAVARFGRVRDIRSVGTTIATLTRLAQKEIDNEVGVTSDDVDQWVPIRDVIGSARIPPDVAALLHDLVDRLLASGDITDNARWRAVELATVSLLAELDQTEPDVPEVIGAG